MHGNRLGQLHSRRMLPSETSETSETFDKLSLSENGIQRSELALEFSCAG